MRATLYSNIRLSDSNKLRVPLVTGEIKLTTARRRLLIPLNVCRHKELYMPWKCEDERHGYEK